ncbi:MAG: hypothetical protein EZS28_007723 [Streblomastix strix]|uniref:Uncharacterized protein n=1 Tax=Streblomastix strix TaxID=222440 RepID=A0A5J4WP95_9EUKA|nr:MAG: hypothetical protein EZS28_007723 [Streblomastix strix]
MTRRTNQTNRRPTSRDSYQTPNYANLVPQNPLQVAAQLQPTFKIAFRQNLEIDPLDPDQTITTPDEIPPNAITAALALLAGLSGQDTSQIDFYAEEPSEEQVVEAGQRIRAATDLAKRRKPPKHNNPPAQPMLTFDQILADLETKLLQQNRLLQGTLTQIHKRHDLQGNHDVSAGRHDRIKELTEDPTITNNTSRVKQLEAEIAVSTILDGRNTSNIGRYIIKKNYRLHKRIGPRTKEADSATSNRSDQERARDNVIRIGSRSRQETNAGNLTDCAFTTFKSVAATEPESVHITQSFLQRTFSAVNVRIIAVIIPLQILQTTNSILYQAYSVPDYPIIESVFTNDESTVNTNMRTLTIKQRKCKRLTKRDSTESTSRMSSDATTYLQQQTFRIPLLLYTTQRGQQRRHSKRSLTPTLKKTDESEEDDFLDQVTYGITIPHLLPHNVDLETAQIT